MSRKDIRDVLGLEEGEPLVREDCNEKELEKRFQKVAEYKKICEKRKRPDWNKLSKFRPSPNPGLELYFNKSGYNLKRLREIPQNIADYFSNIRHYFLDR